MRGNPKQRNFETDNEDIQKLMLADDDIGKTMELHALLGGLATHAKRLQGLGKKVTTLVLLMLCKV